MPAETSGTPLIAAKPSPSAPGRVRSLAALGAVLFAVGVGAGVAVGPLLRPRTSSPSPAEEKAEPLKDVVTFALEKQAAAGVEAVPVAPTPFVQQLWRTGKVSLNEERVAHISPPTDGVLRDVPVRLGQTVAAGEALAVLESREFGQSKLEFLKAKVTLAAERESATRTRTTMANGKELLDLLAAETPLDAIEKALRDKPIGEWRQQLVTAYTKRTQLKAEVAAHNASGGVVSEMLQRKTRSDLDAAESTYASLVEELKFQVKNQVRQAELKLKDAETTHDVAKARLLLFGLTADTVEALDPVAEGAKASHLAIKAPFAGTVVEKHAVLAERVRAESQLFVLADLSTVWVQSDLFEPDLPLIRGVSTPAVSFRSIVAGVSERPAKALHVGDLIDKSSRSFTLTAEAANPDRALKPGMFVEVGFDTGDHAPVLQLPAAAVLRHENKPFVFVQQGESAFRRVDVVLGRTAGDNVEITDGLKAGDRVVVRGGFVLKSELLKDQMVGE